METKNLTVNVSRNKKLEKVIMMFFTKSGSLIECKDCSKLLRGYNFILKQHLKVNHEHLWNRYLSEIRTEMTRNPIPSLDSSVRGNFLKCQVSCQSSDGVEVILSLPESRLTRENFSDNDLLVLDQLDGFKGRIQKEYNTDPNGPYMGPFDQSEKLLLKLQLPKSQLSFRQYTEFRHEESVNCHSYSIQKSYEGIDDLEKIQSLEIDADECGNESRGNKETIIYTCRSKTCQIPCICKDCCMGESQCKIHKIRHEDVFNYEEDSITIRSSESLFKDSSFLSNSYTIRYSNIPIKCSPCAKDLLHHNLYHLKYHESCKFCLQIRHKLEPSTPKDFHKEIKKHESFMQFICPHCDKIFVEKSKKNKHVEYAHGNVRLNCSLCEENFASKQALVYHEDVAHNGVTPVKCEQCEASFTTKVSLKNHLKFVHSSVPKIACSFCGTQFKQKKDLNFHLRKKHEINTNDHFMNEWNNAEEKQRFQCDLCESNYKYKKDLETHKKNHKVANHTSDKSNIEERFNCELCDLSYKNKKGLNEHKRNKHEGSTFTCNICGKSFNQKNNCSKHERNHKQND